MSTSSAASISPSELVKILADHFLWRRSGGAEGARAVLIRADLAGSNLAGANLEMANLGGANLRGANFERAKLSNANLRDTILVGANLRHAAMAGVDIVRADLSGADLSGTSLAGVRLTGTNLAGANIPDFQRCPKEGVSFKAFKKVCVGSEKYVLELEVPADAKRLNSTGIKCRCSKAKVIRAMNLDGTNVENHQNLVFQSMHALRNGFSFPYRVGESVEIKDFNDDVRYECAPGVHFYREFQEAVDGFV